MSTVYLVYQKAQVEELLEIWTTRRLAELRIKELEKRDPEFAYFVQEITLNERS